MITRDTRLCHQSVIWSSVMDFCHRAARCRSPDWEGLSGLLVAVGEDGGLKRLLGPLNSDIGISPNLEIPTLLAGLLPFGLFGLWQLLRRGVSQCIMDAVGYPLAGLLHPGVMQMGITQGGLTASVS